MLLTITKQNIAHKLIKQLSVISSSKREISRVWMTPLMPSHFSLKTCFSKKNTIRYSIHSYDNLLPVDIIIHSYLFSLSAGKELKIAELIYPSITTEKTTLALTTESNQRKRHKSLPALSASYTGRSGAHELLYNLMAFFLVFQSVEKMKRVVEKLVQWCTKTVPLLISKSTYLWVLSCTPSLSANMFLNKLWKKIK